MYTNCPECGTVFRISTNDLRVAEGYVRCGNCSATFNALATLADELPSTITLQQLSPPREAEATVGSAPDAPAPSADPKPDMAPAGLPGFPAEPASHPTLPELQPAATDVPLPISEDTLEFDIPEDSWSNFFGTNGPEQDAAARVDPEPQGEPRAEPQAGDSDQDAHPQLDADIGTGIGSDTVDQAGLYLALSGEAGGSPREEEGDWQALLEEVQDDEASPQPVYVIGEEPHDALAGGGPQPAPLPADFAVDFPVATAAAPEPVAELKPGAPAGPEPGIRAEDRPFLWKPPAPPAVARSGPHRAYTAGSVLLALLLLIQVLHQQRDELATNPALTVALQRTYAALGQPLWPAWNLQAYELRNSEAVADRSSLGALDILARIAVVGNDPVGLPLVRVTLRDRLSRPLGTRVFQPEEYLGAKSRPRAVVSPGTLIPVEISLKDPGADAQGFDVDVCVMSRREGIVCRVDREPFVR